MAITDEICAHSKPLEFFVDCNVQLKQQVQAIAAPLAAAAEVDASPARGRAAQAAVHAQLCCSGQEGVDQTGGSKLHFHSIDR